MPSIVLNLEDKNNDFVERWVFENKLSKKEEAINDIIRLYRENREKIKR